MAIDYFLKLDGVEGESQDSKHKAEIELQSFSWGASQTGTHAAGGGGGAGKVNMHDFSFSMKTCKASPTLLLNCASGKHITKGLLTCRKAGEKQQEYMKIKFTDLLVSSFQTGGHAGGDEIPTDQISLNFAKIEYEYYAQKKDGSLEGPFSAGWDLKANVKV